VLRPSTSTESSSTRYCFETKRSFLSVLVPKQPFSIVPFAKLTKIPFMAPSLTVRDSSKDSSGSNYSDRMALAAVVIAVLAFFISILQTLIAYLTSQLRDKCSQGAIGGWQKYSKTGWDFWNYRLRVLYPQVDLDCLTILTVRRKLSVQLSNHSPHFQKFIKGSPGMGWADMLHCDDRDHLKPWHIWYGTNVLYQERGSQTKAVSLFQLPYRAQIEWVLFLYRIGGRQRYIPARASWANVISCLGTCPSPDLVQRRELADIIPEPWMRHGKRRLWRTWE
jgi:hypothetical protein